jgi:PKHD-type hydroxylase
VPKTNSYYKIPTGITKEICNSITESFKNEILETSGLVQQENGSFSNEFDFNMRKSQNLWIPTDHWISGMMAHFIHCANKAYFKYDLENWSNEIQYTVYDGKGTHYDWHDDMSPSLYDKLLIRKLSISLMLSSQDDYRGGELQLRLGPKTMDTVNLNMGDAIVFSSDTIHRVRPLKSGKRISLVGWFAGPKFK